MARQNHTAFVPLGSAGNYIANAADLPKVNADVANGEETEIFQNEKTLVLIFNDTIGPFNVNIDSVKDPFGRKKNIVNYSIPIAEFAMFGGLAINREDFGDPEGPESQIEALGSLHLSVFTFDTPETQLDLKLFVYPGLSETARQRAELDITLRKEIIEDFFWDLSFYDSFDRQPPIAGLEKNDWWLVTGLGWSW